MRLHSAHGRDSGISQLELVILLGVLGVIAGIGAAVVGVSALEGTREARLRSELNTLNSAVNTYLAFGGAITPEDSSEDILARLKTSVSDEQRDRIPGISGSLIDRSIHFVMQTKGEAESSAPRLLWDATNSQFMIANGGPPGIKMLARSDGGEDSQEVILSERNHQFLYAKEDDWIWDYTEGTPIAQIGPSEIPTSSVPTSPVAPLTPPTPSNKDTLLPPQFSIPPGTYPAGNFDLGIALSNPNPVGSSTIFYTINYGAWSLYPEGSTISIGPDTSLRAQSLPVDKDRWEASETTEGYYEALGLSLIPPLIEFSKPLFNRNNTSDAITVQLKNPNPAGSSSIVYKLKPFAGGSGIETAELNYGSPFPVRLRDYSGGFVVEAFAKSSSPSVENSDSVARSAHVSGELEGGHLDLDTATSITAVRKGDTDAHTHDITGKYGISAINFLALPESKQIELDEAISSSTQRFKLVVVNGSLSPGMILQLDYVKDGTTYSIAEPVFEYDNRNTDEMEVFSFGTSVGSAKLTGVKVAMAPDVLLKSGVIPTNTGDVRDNTPGKEGEWRNGAFTLQAVAVNPDGTDAFTLDRGLSNGGEGAASSGLLWEGILFWHWKGDSYHESGNNYEPGNFGSNGGGEDDDDDD